jgi:hypothetical protein
MVKFKNDGSFKILNIHIFKMLNEKLGLFCEHNYLLIYYSLICNNFYLTVDSHAVFEIIQRDPLCLLTEFPSIVTKPIIQYLSLGTDLDTIKTQNNLSCCLFVNKPLLPHPTQLWSPGTTTLLSTGVFFHFYNVVWTESHSV